MASIVKFTNRMRYWCEEANLGYSQADRWNIKPGGDADCSSLVIFALREAGFDTGSASYTGNMLPNLLMHGWKRVPNNGNPQPGDILLNIVHHVAVYLGGGQLAQASYSENRSANGRPGDQTGHETNVGPYYDYPWDCYLRYVGAQNSPAAPTGTNLAVDGSWGPATTRRLQQVLGTTADGVISGQIRCRANEHIASIQFGSGGSDMVAAMSHAMGITDMPRNIGPGFVSALQRRLGTTVDGVISPTSDAVRALQRRLNLGRW
jgi:hypothetical protein